MATLYEMTEPVRALYELLENGEIDEATYNDTLEAIGVDEKAEGYCRVISQLNLDLDMYLTEIKRLTDRKKTLENSLDRLKRNLLDLYIAGGRQKIKAGTFTISSRKSQSVDIFDESKLTDEYFNIQKTPNKTAIKNAIKDGKTVDGANLVERESVQIK